MIHGSYGFIWVSKGGLNQLDCLTGNPTKCGCLKGWSWFGIIKWDPFEKGIKLDILMQIFMVIFRDSQFHTAWFLLVI